MMLQGPGEPLRGGGERRSVSGGRALTRRRAPGSFKRLLGRSHSHTKGQTYQVIRRWGGLRRRSLIFSVRTGAPPGSVTSNNPSDASTA